MHPELTNLLPADRKRALRRDYFIRVVVVSAYLLALVLTVHGLLLIPAYLYLGQEIAHRESQLAVVQNSASTLENKEIKARIDILETNAARLISQNGRPTASRAMRAVLEAPRTGIRLTGLTYGAAATPEARKMSLKGVAANREVLRSYVQAVEALPSVTKAELPISAYARERDIEFTLTLTGTFTP